LPDAGRTKKAANSSFLLLAVFVTQGLSPQTAYLLQQ